MKKAWLCGSMVLLFIAVSVLPWVARTSPQDDAWTVLFDGDLEEAMAAYAGGPTLDAPNETQSELLASYPWWYYYYNRWRVTRKWGSRRLWLICG